MCSFNFHSSQRQQLKEPVDAKCIIFLQTDTSAHFFCLVFAGSYFVLCGISSAPSIHKRCLPEIMFCQNKEIKSKNPGSSHTSSIYLHQHMLELWFAHQVAKSEDEAAVEGADISHTARRLFLALTVASLYVAAPTLTVIDPSLDASEWNT